ncbi:MAG: HU family DNA-binding protein [Clostridiales bacterium]|nr:HU family DNA-binding protein [Clostridiales bacterium]
METIPDSILSALGRIVTDALVDGDQVALPSFGTLDAVKTDEQVVADPQSGKHILMPPAINVQFTAALKLVKSIKERRSLS